MNVIGLCQGANLRIFAELVRLTADNLSYVHIGVFAADASYALQSPVASALEQVCKVSWLNEWESVNTGLARTPDYALINQYEAELGAPSLWSAILADRRLIFGRYCKSKQDYRPRFTEKQLLGVLTEALLRVEVLFKAVEPDVVLGFVPVTLHEYLILRIAEARGIKIRLLRSTKIENFVSLNDRLFGLSRHIRDHFENTIYQYPEDVYEAADRYISNTIRKGAVYEGMHLPSYAYRRFKPLAILRALAGAMRNEFRRIACREIREDNHNPGYLVPVCIQHFLQPFRAAKARSIIAASQERLRRKQEEYCFFPLHFEPEIALQIFARPLQNQIEVARSIALSLPAGMKLLVKEHPRSAGFRSSRYYKKLLEIPNVVLVGAERASHELVRSARIVVVITGNIGLEAAVLGVPVIVLGEVDYAVLPRHLLRICHNLYELSAEIKALLSDFKKDEEAVRRYVCASVASAVQIDLYSVLLAKSGRHGFSSGERQSELESLKNYVIGRFATGV